MVLQFCCHIKRQIHPFVDASKYGMLCVNRSNNKVTEWPLVLACRDNDGDDIDQIHAFVIKH